MIVIAEDSVRFAHSGPFTQSTSSRYCGTRILLAPPPSPREREGPSDISYRVAKRSSDRTLARRPCLEMPRWHPRVAKGSSDRSSARGPCPQVLQSHPRVAKGASGSSLAQGPCPQVLQRHPGVAKQSSIGSSSIKCRYSMDIEVRIGFLSMKCRCFMDGCLGLDWVFA